MPGKVCIGLLYFAVVAVIIHAAPYSNVSRTGLSAEGSKGQAEGIEEVEIQKLVNNEADLKSGTVNSHLEDHSRQINGHEKSLIKGKVNAKLPTEVQTRVSVLRSLFSPEQVAAVILSTHDFTGFLDAMDELEKTKLISPKEVAFYKADVAMEMEKLFQEAEVGARLLLMEATSQVKALNQGHPKENEGSTVKVQASKLDVKKEVSTAKPTSETQGPNQQTQTNDTVSENRIFKIADLLPTEFPNAGVAKFIQSFGIADNIINALLYDWMTAGMKQGKTAPRLSIDDFMHYLRQKEENARQKGQLEVAGVVGRLMDAIAAEYNRRLVNELSSRAQPEVEFKVPKDMDTGFSAQGNKRNNEPESNVAQNKGKDPVTVGRAAVDK
ncbi:uncharacterized protein LOC106169997 [Lingula anatina]|uniref:Uncharacterized protein LOC106169997 n=1 Tax=Lingula anatina TaxID=7574 RepID=A0A1S3J438_LINAN|nr:uncharacterized protein LOC106169997 [Lingula anatina]|eukprot:XP_013405145.1 uncharacterized protein LOC106169997 [Lingula anatina]